MFEEWFSHILNFKPNKTKINILIILKVGNYYLYMYINIYILQPVTNSTNIRYYILQ